jgi:hypothetical protein
MPEYKVAVFFYCSYINLDVLREVEPFPDKVEVARLDAFDIHIGPFANLVPSDGNQVYGIRTHATHAELERLYAHAAHVLGAVYLPHPVLVHTTEGSTPALCYIAPRLEPAPPEGAYLDRIVSPAREFGFPAWYVARLESFRR